MLDRVEIKLKAGDGGNGIIAFHREKFVPMGGPSGGDGGNGGNIVIRASDGLDTLQSFKRKRFFRAESGDHGQGGKKKGKQGAELVLEAPPGTLVIDKDRKLTIADLLEPGQEVIIARGGKGGWGNSHFATPSNQAPRIANKGQPGEEKSIVLELKIIADVGILGYPNAGKSSLLTAISAARPEIAPYPFTTKEPVLGVVEIGEMRLVVAEIPGLIEGAHLGKGLGHDFLRHATRTRVFIHLVDGTSKSPVEDMLKVNAELTMFDPALGAKPQIVAVNKVDLPEVNERRDEIKSEFDCAGIEVRFISALNGEGCKELVVGAAALAEAAANIKKEEVKPPTTVFRPQPKETPPKIHKEGDVFVIEGVNLAGLGDRLDINEPAVAQQIKRQLIRRGVTHALEKAGIKPGDKVRCASLEWEWE